MRAHTHVVGVENTGGKAYGKATGSYNKPRKYSEQLDPRHPSRSAHNFQLAQSFSKQTKTWIDQDVRHRLDDFIIESFQSSDAVQTLLFRLDFGLGNTNWTEDHSHNFGTLCYRDISKFLQFLLAHLRFQALLHFQPVRLAVCENRQIYSEIIMGD